jgi:hypothetical protein
VSQGGRAIRTYTHRPIVVQFIQFVFQNEPWDTSIFLFICIAVFKAEFISYFVIRWKKRDIKELVLTWTVTF